MALTKGYSLGTAKSTPGIKEFYILGALSTDTAVLGAITDITLDATSGEIETITGTGTWYKFECPATSGGASETGSTSTGGREVTQTLTYRVEGLSKSARDTVESLAEQNDIKVIARGRGNEYYLFGEDNGLTLTTDETDFGTGGGGAETVGTTLSFVGYESSKANKLEAAIGTVIQAPMTVV